MDLLKKIEAAGVVGQGGAGFPTSVKLDCKVDNVILNAVECEPLLKTDWYHVINHTKEILMALRAIKDLVEAKNIYIGIKKKHPDMIEAFKNAAENELLSISLVLLDDYYPAGDEHMLVYEALHANIPAKGLPLDVGAVVLNAGTVYSVYLAMNDIPVTEKALTIAGDICKDYIIKAPIGTTVMGCLNKLDIKLQDTHSVIMGGPMMGDLVKDISSAVISKTTGGILILPNDSTVVKSKSTSLVIAARRAKSACLRCRLCTDLCPRYLLGHPIRPHLVMNRLGFVSRELLVDDNTLTNASLCTQCGICEVYSCPAGLSPRRINEMIVNLSYVQNMKQKAPTEVLPVNEMIDYRKSPVSRISARSNISQYFEKAISEKINITVDRVIIPLKQHVGKEAQASVSVGDDVKKGDLIAKRQGSISANIHASINGRIESINDEAIIIKR